MACMLYNSVELFECVYGNIGVDDKKDYIEVIVYKKIDLLDQYYLWELFDFSFVLFNMSNNCKYTYFICKIYYNIVICNLYNIYDATFILNYLAKNEE